MTRDEWASRMLDRVGLLLFRRPRFEARPHTNSPTRSAICGSASTHRDAHHGGSRSVTSGGRGWRHVYNASPRIFANSPTAGCGRWGTRLLTEIDAAIGEISIAGRLPTPASPRLSACAGRSTLMRSLMKPQNLLCRRNEDGPVIGEFDIYGVYFPIFVVFAGLAFCCSLRSSGCSIGSTSIASSGIGRCSILRSMSSCSALVTALGAAILSFGMKPSAVDR